MLAWLVSAALAQTPAELADQLTGRKQGPERTAAERAAVFAQVIESTVPGLSSDDANAKSQSQSLLERVVFHAGRPGGEADRQAAVAALLPLAAKPGARFCRQQLLLELRLLGRADAVAGLVALLADGDEVVAQSARMALESNPTPEAGRALIEALDKAPADRRVAFINALGHRREAAALAPLAKLIADPQAAGAALAALAQIATPEAIDALVRARQGATGAARAAAENALLVAAGRRADQGDAAGAGKLFDDLYRNAASQDVRLAGLRGWALASGEKALPALLDLLAKDAPEARVAARLARNLAGGNVAAAYGDKLTGLAEPVQITLCGALQERGDKAALPGLRALAGKADAPAGGRAAAVTALGALGGVSEVELLLPLESGPDPVGGATRQALTRLGGPEVTSFLLKQVATGDAARRTHHGGAARLGAGQRGAAGAGRGAEGAG
ncbi:MAG: hypothetical protein HYU66_10845 [Armatimonadetes bacterium]|nr:hypothetical protein [Armatimonadota bacterium]